MLVNFFWVAIEVRDDAYIYTLDTRDNCSNRSGLYTVDMQ